MMVLCQDQLARKDEGLEAAIVLILEGGATGRQTLTICLRMMFSRNIADQAVANKMRRRSL